MIIIRPVIILLLLHYHTYGPRARTGLFMFLSPKGSLVVSIGKIYEKSKYASLTNLTVAVFPKNDIEEGYPQVMKY